MLNKATHGVPAGLFILVNFLIFSLFALLSTCFLHPATRNASKNIQSCTKVSKLGTVLMHLSVFAVFYSSGKLEMMQTALNVS